MTCSPDQKGDRNWVDDAVWIIDTAFIRSG
jgi:hypothetical protein